MFQMGPEDILSLFWTAECGGYALMSSEINRNVLDHCNSDFFQILYQLFEILFFSDLSTTLNISKTKKAKKVLDTKVYLISK